MDRLFEIGCKLGLEGEELKCFIADQQAIERDQRAIEREERERERQHEERERERQHELEMKRLELQVKEESLDGGDGSISTRSTSSTPKLPSFVDFKDDLDSYLNRFERFAKSNKWERSIWSTALSALLTGRALDVYSRLSEEVAADYDALKEALLKRYDLTEPGFRNRFRNSKSEDGESPEQFITRLRNYLNRWIELSGTERNYDDVCNLFIKEQFISSCPSDLEVFLKERAPRDLVELSKLADQYLIAHNRSLSSRCQEKKPSPIHVKQSALENHFNTRGTNARASNWTSTANFHAANRTQRKCIFCSFAHRSEDCRKLQSMSVSLRKERILNARACLRCLKMGHFASACRSGGPCKKCGKNHHVIICEEPRRTTPVHENTEITTASMTSTHSPRVLLMTASVLVEGMSGKEEVRLLIDGGSQRSYIRSSLARSITAKRLNSENLQIQSFGERSLSGKLDLVNVNLISKVGAFKGSFKLLSTTQLCSPLETVPVGPWITELEERGFLLADETQTTLCSKKPIDIILGADQLWKIFNTSVFTTSYGVVACETKFGWVLQGQLSDGSTLEDSTVTTVLFTGDISQFWQLETIGITSGSDESYFVVDRFNSSIEREEDGRYKVPLIWKDRNERLESNLQQAEHRLKCLESKLEKDTQLKKDYSQVFEDYKNLKIIERVPDCEVQKDHDVFYLPHHAVVKKDSKSTKVRPVFDGSATDRNGTSLNELLDPGPSLLPKLVDLLLRFRQYTVPFTGDITKAFLQLSLKEEERDFVRFLWDGDVFRFRRVCFGISCAPFLLNATIRYHLMNSPGEVSVKMLKSFYVDDLLMGSFSLESSFSEIESAIGIMKAACMSLTKWATSDQLLASQLKADLKLDVQHTGITKVLGVTWNLETDELEFEVPKWDMDKFSYTKRFILSYTSKVYDPLGLAAPVVVSLKIFLKLLWTSGYDWDETLSHVDSERFLSLLSSLSDVDKFSVPRPYSQSSDQHSFVFHLFCDSSEQAYAACVYIQFTSSQGPRTSSLVIAKTRLSPEQRVTLPRLELLACFIGAKLLRKVLDALEVPPNVKFYCWTDSTIALSWIRSSSSRYKQFVSNRIQSIQSITPPSCWNHCPGDENPADQATRPISFNNWNKSLWFHGPSWLNHSSQWPKAFRHSSSESEDPEVKENAKNEIFSMVCDAVEDVFDLTRYSTLNKAVRIYSLVNRAIRKFKMLVKKDGFSSEDNLTPFEEFEKSKANLIKREQWKFFQKEINCLKADTKTHFASKLRNLHLTLHDGYLISVGRIDFDHLIVLPHDSYLTKLIILEAHISLCHSGVATTLTNLRSKYWIIKGRRSVRSSLRSCLVCRRHDCQPYLQEEAPLSDYRLKRRKPFEISGCDHAGPFYPKEGGKVYLLIFTCTVIRAVHLEMCLDLRVEEFLLAFRRFQARFGTPKIVVSDNSKTFRAASVSLQEKLQWRFTPEYSPSWGGLWERLIRSVKTSMKKILGSQKINKEMLRTLFCEIESAINKRPLTYLSDDPNDMKPLRPIDFFSGTSVEDAEINFTELVKKYRERNHYLERLWKRWKTEYLLHLRSWSNKRSQGKVLPSVGDVVLVDPRSLALKNRSLWPLGKVLEVFVGKNGFPRSASVLVNGKVCRRNTSQVYPLEVCP